METLGSGTTYLVDLVDLDEPRDLVRVWHCGSAALTLASDPAAAVQSVHCNRRIGVAGDFPLKAGRVTLARLSTAGGRWQMVMMAGEAISAPNRFQGNTADVVLDGNATRVVRQLVAGGAEHHHVIAWEDVRPQLRRVAQIVGIPVVELT
jgi:L-arabinose isomerase